MSHATTSPTTSPLKYLLFSVLFISACSPLSATTIDKTSTINKPAETSPADRARALQQWIDARTAYEETLDYSSLEEDKAYKYKAMRRLVETKYFLMLAEKDLQYNTDKSVALEDFNQARRLLKKSMATAINAADRQKMEAIDKKLNGMQRAVERDINAKPRWLPMDQRSEFDNILAQLEDIIRGQ